MKKQESVMDDCNVSSTGGSEVRLALMQESLVFTEAVTSSFPKSSRLLWFIRNGGSFNMIDYSV